MNTISLPYQTSQESKDIILSYMKNQNNVIRFIYNRIQENKELTQIELTELVDKMNNIFIDSWFKQCAICKAQDLSEKEKVIFGGKKLFLGRLNNKITKEKFQIKKLLPLYIIGESSKQGNRKFDFKIIEENKLIFKPNRKIEIELLLPKIRKNYKKILYKLQQITEEKIIPITISIDLEQIHITYDEGRLSKDAESKKNRIMALDLNPNFIGYSIIDWKNKDHKNIINTGIFSIKKINDKQFELKKEKINVEDPKMKHSVNKRHFEIYEIAKRIANLARNYHVENFGIEDLTIKSGDKLKGTKYNRLTNNLWNRNKFTSNLKKRLKLSRIKLCELYPQYSTFIGNILNNEYPDCVASSIEINRRCFCLVNKIKPVLFPDFRESINGVKQSLEELFDGPILMDEVNSWKDLYKQVTKNPKLRYRVPLEDGSFKVFSLSDRKSLVDIYQFI